MYSRATYFLFMVLAAQFSRLAYGQSGSLTYGPAYIAVPINDSLWVLLALAIAGLGYWVLRQREIGRLLGVILSLSTSIGIVSVGLYIKDAGAPPPIVNLDSATGGTVVVPESFQEYLNASGVEIKINDLTDPCGSSAPNVASNACAESSILALGESCATQFQCPQPEICDGIDNDLDTQTDEGLLPPDLGCAGAAAPSCTGVGGWQCPLVCAADCNGKACGSDGCGGSCGSCSTGSSCSADGTACNADVCGDAICGTSEDAFSCPADCP